MHAGDLPLPGTSFSDREYALYTALRDLAENARIDGRYSATWPGHRVNVRTILDQVQELVPLSLPDHTEEESAYRDALLLLTDVLEQKVSSPFAPFSTVRDQIWGELTADTAQAAARDLAYDLVVSLASHRGAYIHGTTEALAAASRLGSTDASAVATVRALALAGAAFADGQLGNRPTPAELAAALGPTGLRFEPPANLDVALYAVFREFGKHAAAVSESLRRGSGAGAAPHRAAARRALARVEPVLAGAEGSLRGRRGAAYARTARMITTTFDAAVVATDVPAVPTTQGWDESSTPGATARRAPALAETLATGLVSNGVAIVLGVGVIVSRHSRVGSVSPATEGTLRALAVAALSASAAMGTPPLTKADLAAALNPRNSAGGVRGTAVTMAHRIQGRTGESGRSPTGVL